MKNIYGQSALIRRAVAYFNFVYIHPLADGNGQVYRFLINEPIILVISQAIAKHHS